MDTAVDRRGWTCLWAGQVCSLVAMALVNARGALEGAMSSGDTAEVIGKGVVVLGVLADAAGAGLVVTGAIQRLLVDRRALARVLLGLVIAGALLGLLLAIQWALWSLSRGDGGRLLPAWLGPLDYLGAFAFMLIAAEAWRRRFAQAPRLLVPLIMLIGPLVGVLRWSYAQLAADPGAIFGRGLWPTLLSTVGLASSVALLAVLGSLRRAPLVSGEHEQASEGLLAYRHWLLVRILVLIGGVLLAVGAAAMRAPTAAGIIAAVMAPVDLAFATLMLAGLVRALHAPAALGGRIPLVLGWLFAVASMAVSMRLLNELAWRSGEGGDLLRARMISEVLGVAALVLVLVGLRRLASGLGDARSAIRAGALVGVAVALAVSSVVLREAVVRGAIRSPVPLLAVGVLALVLALVLVLGLASLLRQVAERLRAGERDASEAAF
jgi:hypothetical protein